MKLNKWAGIAALALLSTQAQAQAIISNGTIKLGVNQLGALNVGGGVASVGSGTTTVGLRLLTPRGEYESTAPGCLCEGWGAGIATGTGSGLTGYQNLAGGTSGLSLVSFTSTASTAKSIVTIGGSLEVTHEYVPSSQANLYEVKVSIKNISGGALGDAATGIVYRRVMDWDIDPTAFSENVKVQGWPATNLWHTSNDGFESANPLSGFGSIGGCGAGDNINFVSLVDCDQGALFDFKFGALGAGETINFSTFYGAATTEAALLSAMGAVGVEVYSTAACRDGFAAGACPAIHGFGFKGVGGTSIPVPEPATLALVGTGLVGLVAARRRRSA